MMKTLHNSDISGAQDNVPDLKVFGNGDMFHLLCKASSKEEGWMKSTKSLEIKEYSQPRDYSSDELYFWMDVLEEYMQYNPETGKVTWKKTKTNKTQIDDIVGSQSPNQYCNIKFEGRQIHAHRLAFIAMCGYLPKLIDHKDRNRSNNVWTNLREANTSINVVNSGLSSSNSSGTKGVHYDNKRQKWVATIQCRNNLEWLGYFDDKEDAIQARVEAEERYGFNTTYDKIVEKTVGCIVQVTTQQWGNVAEALCFVPGVKIVDDSLKGGRRLVSRV